MKWTQEYPKLEGFYWIKRSEDEFPKVEDFWPGENGRLCAIDNELNEYYQESFKGYWFSNDPIKEPEDWWE